MFTVSPEVSAHYEELKSIYRSLHQEPELLYDLPKTSAFVLDYLQNLGFAVQHNIGKSGVVATLPGEGPCILLRADMDALPIHENSGVDFPSKVPGRMHACGHDAHTAMLLVAAKLISKLPSLKGSVKFVFQPAEEGGHGALAMVKDNVLEGVDEVYAIHTCSPLKLGDFVYHDTQASVFSDRFFVKVYGKGGHGSMPHNTIDPVPVAAQLILDFNRLAGNRNDPVRIQTNCVRSSDTFNAIPTVVSFSGSVRSISRLDRDDVAAKMTKICEGFEAMHNVKVEFVFEKVYEGVKNSPVCGEFALKALGKVCHGTRIEKVLHIGEDFSYFSNIKPGAYVLFGVSDENGYSMHSSKFRLNEESLMIGTQYWLNLVQERLGNSS